MRCVNCNRPLKKAAFTMPSAKGTLAWGPVCAASRIKPAKPVSREVGRWKDGFTMDLFQARA